MNGIVINIDPVILYFGGFALRWHSLEIMLGIIAAMLIAIYEGKRKGLPINEIYSLTLWVVLGGVVGARLFHVIDEWSFYASNPALILQFQRGGLAIWGGLAGGAVVTVAYARVKHLPLARLVDVMTPGLLAAQIIGRFGCIINGDAYGGLTDLPWAFTYTHPGALVPLDLRGVPTHPYPLYEAIWNGLVLLAIWRLRHVFKKDGQVLLSYLPLYSLGRFFLTFVRQQNVTFGGLQQAQMIALFVFVASVAMWIYWGRKRALMVSVGDKSEPSALGQEEGR